MPDWSYHPMKKILLDKLKPETSREFIHNSMSTIASIPGGRSIISFLGHMKPPKELQKQISHIHFPSPIGLSGHIDPNLTGLKAFQELGFGFIEIGPIVLNRKEQKTPILKNQQILFSNDYEKVPLQLAIKKLTTVNYRIPILAKIDPSVTKLEWDLIVHHLTPFVDAFIGTKEQINTYVDDSLLALERSFFAVLTYEDLIQKDIKFLIEQQNAFQGLVVTPPFQKVEGYWREHPDSTEWLSQTVRQLKELSPDLFVITSGGVETPAEALELIDAGTDLLLLTDGYVRAGPGLPKRIHERMLHEEPNPVTKHSWYWSILFGLSILIGGCIAIYFAFTSIILSYDESFIGLTREELLLVNPRILAFMAHDRMALAGTMISAGILYIQLARHGLKYGLHWAKVTFHSAAIVGFLGILLFIGYGYFDWLHGLFWLILLPIYYFSFKEGKNFTRSPSSNHGTNDRLWNYGLYGQLMFIILGFSILIGGIVISAIGISNVFVSTDISFICMTPEMLDTISNRLIPVIAHDRAGFGSALISVGLLVLMLSLWGFRQGERWLWNTLAIGALPAFIAGIGTHFYIGYTTFIHLLPVYFLVVLYVLGLALSYPYLKRPRNS